ncbi:MULTISPECIES: SAM-dependent methyltransferase [unclassified Mycobacterium]|uniref:SAM-dependent methyltransferase n=1 Tax=unclassified Mycobacterium TaxID=2642494 RepID=UPI00082D20FA|nr:MULTISPECIES: SAM-dependent methyltransferase [unclassified Mycobacterium]
MTEPIDGCGTLETCGGVLSALAAAARAVASRDLDPVINDPFAEVLVRAVEYEPLTQLIDSATGLSDIGADWFPAYFGIRSRTFDDFADGATQVGIRQVVLLEPGLDCRAYRLDWPDTTAIYEIDRRAVIDWKQCILSNLNSARLRAQHRYVPMDVGQQWPAKLRQAGFDEAKPTAWIAEGLFVGHPSATAQTKTLDTITALSARASRVAADYVDTRVPELASKAINDLLNMSRKHDPLGALCNVTFPKLHDDLALSLDERGWITYTADLEELFRDVGRAVPPAGDFPEYAKLTRFLSGVRT